MLQWQHLFSNSILNRGREYYRCGRVRELEKIDSTWFAEVRGTRRYHVIITLRDSSVAHMECSCPAAEESPRCKHMAATLYAIQNQELPLSNLRQKSVAEEKATVARKKANPFYTPAEGEYRFFDLNRLMQNFEIYEDTVQKARRLLAEGVTGLRIQTGYSAAARNYGSRGMACTATVRLKAMSEFSETCMIFDNRTIVYTSCPYPRCKAYYTGYIANAGRRELCEHTTALLLLADEYLKNHEDGDTTDYEAQQMLTAFRRKRQNLAVVTESSDEENPDVETVPARRVELEPRLLRQYDGLTLSFRAGVGKPYVVRGLTEFVNAVENREQLVLGKLCTLDFSNDMLSDSAGEYYKLIRGIVRDVQFRSEYNGESSVVKGEILLYGSTLDRFYQLTEGRTVSFQNKCNPGHTVETRLRVCEGKPEIRLQISQDIDTKGVFHGIVLEAEIPELYDGASHKYFLDDGALMRVDAQHLDGLEDLQQMFRRNTRVRIGRNNLTEFYHNVLPAIREYATVLEPDADMIDPYLPPEVLFRFKLDAENGRPMCCAEAVYGEKTYNLTEWLQTGHRQDRSRDSMRETAVVEAVRNYFPQEDLQNGEFTAADSEDAMYRVITEGVDALRRYGEVYCTSRFQSLSVRRKVSIKVGVSVDSDIMNLSVSSELSNQELAELLQSYRAKKKYHRLTNGEFIALDDSVAELDAIMREMHVSLKEFVSGKTEIPAYRALYLDKMLEQISDVYLTRDRTYRNLIRDFKTVSESDFEVPESLQDVLRPYQRYGYKWLRTLSAAGFGGILADDMGLGKTLQLITVLLAEKEEGVVGTSLIVCPASLVYNWMAELQRFAPELSVGVVAGTRAERRELLEHYARYDVLVTSYDLLKRDCTDYEGKMFLYLAIDEAQYIKNHSTGASKTVRVLRSRHRVAMTGTPIENRLSELWSIFDFLMPGFLYAYEEFRAELETPITKKKDELASERLRRMVRPFILRRLKEDVLKDLPEKIEEARYVRFDEAQQQLYDAQVAHMRDMLENKTEKDFNTSKIQILAELTKIREICCDPTLLFENYSGGSAKREACLDLVRTAIEGGHRLLVFSQFTSMLALLEESLRGEGISYFIITGATPKKERLALVNRFNEGAVPVFLISLKAGGTGLNLTGADMVVHYDPWWNVAAQNQATDRAHRIGQTKVVTVYQLLVQNSVEENIRKMQEAKKNLAEEVLSGEGASFSSLTREELLELLG